MRLISLSLRTLVFAVLVPATIAIYVPWLIPAGEPGLHDRFDGAYDDYRRRVPRWIPRV